MALTKAQKAQAVASLVRRLPQSAAAELIGRPTVWLRDNAHIEGRNADGTYDAIKLVAAIRREFVAAELSDSDLEPVMQMAGEIALCGLSRPKPAAAHLARIRDLYGIAGLAAVGEILLDHLDLVTSYDAGYEEPPTPTAEELRAETERRIQALSTDDALRHGRVVIVCDNCRSYRWGRKWISSEVPVGYAVELSCCPVCSAAEEKPAKKRRK